MIDKTRSLNISLRTASPNRSYITKPSNLLPLPLNVLISGCAFHFVLPAPASAVLARQKLANVYLWQRRNSAVASADIGDEFGVRKRRYNSAADLGPAESIERSDKPVGRTSTSDG